MSSLAYWENDLRRRVKLAKYRIRVFKAKYPTVIDAARWCVWDADQPPWEEHLRLTDEVLAWLRENTTRAWNSHNTLIGFLDQDEALHFKMRWA